MKYTTQDISSLIENVTGNDDVIGHCSPYNIQCEWGYGPSHYVEDSGYTNLPAEDR